MRILFLNYEYPPLGGGGGVVNSFLAEALALKHEVTVLTSAAYGLTSEETVNRVRVVRVPVYFRKSMQAANVPSMFFYVVNAALKGRKLIGDDQFDIVNTHFVLPTGPVGRFLSKRAGIPNVITTHGGDIYDPSKSLSPHRHLLLRAIVKYLLRKSDAIIGNSVNTNENVAKFYDSTLNCEFIPLGIPRPGTASKSKVELGFNEDEIVLVTVGRLVERKGLDTLISMLSRFSQAKLKLVIVGGGPKENQLKELATRIGVAEQIVFAGQSTEDEKLSYLQAADVYVSTSQHEGFGLVYLEGMAAGLPVVCYNEGGQTGFIEDDANGFLVQLNDTERFIECVNDLTQNKEKAIRFGQRSLEIVAHYFIDTCAAQYESLFEKIVNSNYEPSLPDERHSFK